MLVIKKVLVSSMGFIFFLILCITVKVLRKFSISVLISQIMVFHFVHFEHKRLLTYFDKIYRI